MKNFALLRAIKRAPVFMALIIPAFLMAEGNWPKEIKTDKATIIIYQPQSDSLKGDHLYSRAAVSITTARQASPVFGAIWVDSRFSTDRESGTCTIFNVKVLNVRFPGIDTIEKGKVAEFKKILEEEATNWNLEFSLDELKASLALNQAATSKSENFKNDPPEIIYVKQPSMLLLFDGDPVYKEIENAGLKRAINTPYLVLQDMKDKSYYFYGGDYWYKSSDPVKAAWTNIPKPSEPVEKYYGAMKKEMEKSGNAQPPADKKQTDSKTAAPGIVVRTKPAELLQSKGEPQFAPIQGTQLLYMTNTDDNIFMTIDKNQYFVLLSGRWYRSAAMTGPWVFVESDQLPPDFAKIPEGSEKDIVLASIAGTEAAKDAVMDAQIPQTAAVDRKTAKCEVKYDGDPKFEKINGTDLARGMNTSSTVLLYKNTYYVCDNAVWFVGKGPTGPWEVATSIPGEVQKIPPDDPSYNVKYVYIYEVQPEVVYVGYTPGYVGCYVYGPTVVYGTGYPYPPFYGPYYYPRPVTFGFSMHYNPWYGWSMGFSMSYGMFTFSMRGYPGGYWGPPMYRPPMPPPYGHYYGPRPPAPAYRGGGNTININNNNIYTNRNDRSTRPSQQPSISQRPATGDRTGGTRPSTQPATRPSTGDRTVAKPATQPANRAGSDKAGVPDRSAGQKNNVFTDRNGDVYRNNNGDWQKNNGKSWESAQPRQQDRSVQQQPGQMDRSAQPRTQDRSGSGFNRQDMDRQNAARQRGTQNTTNRSSMQRSSFGGGAGGGGGRRR